MDWNLWTRGSSGTCTGRFNWWWWINTHKSQTNQGLVPVLVKNVVCLKKMFVNLPGFLCSSLNLLLTIFIIIDFSPGSRKLEVYQIFDWSWSKHVAFNSQIVRCTYHLNLKMVSAKHVYFIYLPGFLWSSLNLLLRYLVTVWPRK